jgi:hypothetical protein
MLRKPPEKSKLKLDTGDRRVKKNLIAERNVGKGQSYHALTVCQIFRVILCCSR